jgi:hypothetical protein
MSMTIEDDNTILQRGRTEGGRIVLDQKDLGSDEGRKMAEGLQTRGQRTNVAIPRWDMDRDQIFRDCIADIEDIKSLFDAGRCRDIQLARQRLTDLKAKWNVLVRRFKGTEIERIVEEAATRLPKANTRPGEAWLHDLYDAQGDFTFHLSHRAGTSVG